jgi:hypothetical protein
MLNMHTNTKTTITGALALILMAGTIGTGGCAGGGKADSGTLSADGARVKGKSMPLSEVKAREVAAAESRRLAAEKARAGAPEAEGSVEIPQGDAALAEWLKRAEEGGLVKADGTKRTRAARAASTSETAPEGSELVAAENQPETGAPADGSALSAEPTSTVTDSAGTMPASPSAAVTAVSASNTPGSVVDASMASSRPLAALVRLHAAKAAGDARVTDQQIADLEKSLTPKENEFYSAWKSLQASIAAGTGEGGAGAGGDVSALKRAASQFADATRNWAELRIPKAVLCTRVEGFGRYNELRRMGSSMGTLRAGGSQGPNAGDSVTSIEDDEPAYVFLAGRKNKFIVYCEIDGFASRDGAAMGRSGYEVEIAQDLTLYAGGPASGMGGRDVVAWRKTDQRVKDFSLNQRRDFFMVQIVELPETLTVGAYTLKVRVRDLASGGGGGSAGASAVNEAEAVIPIDIVADASAMGK